MTAASVRSRSPALTSAITDLISSLRSTTSLFPLERAALDAALLRRSACSGEWAQQSPCDPLAGNVQGSPFALVARHTLTCEAPPLLHSANDRRSRRTASTRHRASSGRRRRSRLGLSTPGARGPT